MNLIRLIKSAQLSGMREMVTTEDKWANIKSSVLSVRNTRHKHFLFSAYIKMNLNRFENDFILHSVISLFSFPRLCGTYSLAITKHRWISILHNLLSCYGCLNQRYDQKIRLIMFYFWRLLDKHVLHNFIQLILIPHFTFGYTWICRRTNYKILNYVIAWMIRILSR